MKKIRKNDLVVILAGNDKGKKGKVLRVDGEKVVVEGVNVGKKHTKGNPSANKPGGIIAKEFPMHISNVALAIVNGKGKDGRAFGKVGYKSLEDGRKVRYFKVNNEIIDIS
jgi:large subunit ribosomal protein L24